MCDESLVKQSRCPNSIPRDPSMQPTLLHNPVHLDISPPLILDNSIALRTASWKQIVCTSISYSGSTLNECVQNYLLQHLENRWIYQQKKKIGGLS